MDMSILTIEHLNHGFGEKRLFQDAELRLLPGDHMGLTGPNGSGKSTLIRLAAGQLLAEGGQIAWQPRVTVGYLDQYASVDPALSILDYLRTAYRGLFETDAELARTHEALAHAGAGELERLIARADRLQQALERGGFYAIDSHIARVAAGLGVAALGLERPVGELSGGQRAKVLLAKLLLEAPDVLLLDEPTNFLDRSHIDWLGKFLRGFEGAFLIVSHDGAFLDTVTNCICDIAFGQINRYTGSYASFLAQKEQRREEYVRQYQRQREEIERLEDYINRNRVRTATARQAQSRIKRLNRIERMERPTVAVKPVFRFRHSPVPEPLLLEVEGLAIGYQYPLLTGINLTLRQGQRVAVRGFNGIGKTTFLKTIAGELPSLGGQYHFADRVAVGYYEQDHRWRNAASTPLDEICAAYPRLSPQEVRSYLARCGIRREHVEKPLSTLSGGEQAKVKLCRLMIAPCTLLILDEPTNHLDADAKEALREALAAFDGTVLLVSHDDHFYEGLVDRVFDVERLLRR